MRRCAGVLCLLIHTAFWIAVSLPLTAGEKLVVEFRTSADCFRFVSRYRTATPLVEQRLGEKSARQFSADNNRVHICLDRLRSFAVVHTGNADSLRRLLRFDTTVVRAWTPLRYKLDGDMYCRNSRQPLPVQWYLDVLEAQSAWKLSTGEGVVVGVVDTGIDWGHPLLRQSLWINAGEDLNANGRFDPWPFWEQRDGVSGDLDGLDNDGNGYSDDVIGYNFVYQASNGRGLGLERDPFPFDDNGHGTSVSSLIAASPPGGSGFTGIAFDAKLMVLRAFDATGFGDEDDIAVALVYAVLNGARVINCSFGDIVRSKLVASAIELARAFDVVVVASSGNSGSSLPHYPSDEPGVISVGAATSDNRPALFSSYGERLWVLAPGQNVPVAGAGGNVETVSGTSFAAPLVSGVAALLCALDPSLTADNVRTILAGSAMPATQPWQLQRGHGIVSARRACELAALGGMVRISSPLHRSVVASDRIGATVALDAVHPLLERWQLLCIGSDSVRVLDSSTVAAIGYRRRFENVFSGNDSAVTLRLRVFLRTGKTIEDAVIVSRLSNSISFQSAASHMVWLGRQRRLAVVVRTSRPCEIGVSVEQLGGAPVADIRGDGQYRRVHAVLVPMLPEGIYRVHIAAWDDADTTTMVLDSIALYGYARSNADWNLAGYSAVPLLLSGSFARGGRIVATEMAMPQHATVIERSADTFRTVASSPRTLFLRGSADANRDGRADLLTYDAGDTRLYRFEPVPFDSVIWGDTATHTFWAAALADITGDGYPEILGFRTRRTKLALDGSQMAASDALVAVGMQGGVFRVLDSIEFSSPPQAGRTINTISAPLCAVGDFDGDGHIEIAFADSDGDLEIAQWSNGRFVHEFSAPPQPFMAGAGTEFVAAADVDGDGRSEILAGAPAFPAYNAIGEYEPPLWHFTLYRAVSQDRYRAIWEDYFWGVRYGRPYYNGVSVGDLDGNGSAEIVLALFPYAYVFTWRNGGLELLAVRDSVLSNGALIADLDGNGRAELALTCGFDTLRTRFYEFEPARLAAPVIVEAMLQPDAQLVCRWYSPDAADRYRVKIEGTIVAETADTAVELSTAQIPPCTYCTVTVQAIRQLDSSHWSDPVTVVRAEPLVLDRADTLDAGERIVRLWSSGYLPPNGVSPASVSVEKGDSLWNVEYTAASGRNRLLVWLSQPLSEGLYTIRLHEGTPDLFGNRSPASTVPLVVRSATQSVAEFAAVGLVETSSNSITVRFDDDPDPASLDAEDIDVQPYGRVAAIETTSDRRVLRFILNAEYRYEARGLVYTMTFPRTFRSMTGKLMTGGDGKTVAWFYGAMSSDSTRAFPQPWSRRRDSELRFAHVPLGATVVVSTTAGVELARLVCDDPTGGVRWVPRLSDGTLLPPGVYLYRVLSSDGTESVVQKFVVVP